MLWRVGTELAAGHRIAVVAWIGRQPDSAITVGRPNNPRVQEHVEDAEGHPNSHSLRVDKVAAGKQPEGVLGHPELQCARSPREERFGALL